MQPIIKQIQEKTIGKKNLIAYALQNAIFENQESNLIISNIQDMAKDNYVMIREVLGKELLTDIINFKLK